MEATKGSSSMELAVINPTSVGYFCFSVVVAAFRWTHRCLGVARGDGYLCAQIRAGSAAVQQGLHQHGTAASIALCGLAFRALLCLLCSSLSVVVDCLQDLVKRFLKNEIMGLPPRGTAFSFRAASLGNCLGKLLICSVRVCPSALPVRRPRRGSGARARDAGS